MDEQHFQGCGSARLPNRPPERLFWMTFWWTSSIFKAVDQRGYQTVHLRGILDDTLVDERHGKIINRFHRVTAYSLTDRVPIGFPKRAKEKLKVLETLSFQWHPHAESNHEQRFRKPSVYFYVINKTLRNQGNSTV